jgi:hypothetical protein
MQQRRRRLLPPLLHRSCWQCVEACMRTLSVRLLLLLARALT